jgi:hypothetical protein
MKPPERKQRETGEGWKLNNFITRTLYQRMGEIRNAYKILVGISQDSEGLGLI